MKAKELVTAYYSAFNRRDAEALLSLLSDDVIHDVNQGRTEMGKNAFRDFLGVMDAHYEETARDLTVMVSEDDRNAAAELRIEGIYRKTQAGFPPAKGQTYSIPVGAFYEIANGKIKRVTSYYNLASWIAEVSK